MSRRYRSLGALAALGFVFAACGGSGVPDRFSLVTPPIPSATAQSGGGAPAPSETPDATPVTTEEKQAIRGWSDELRSGDVEGASDYFRIPSEVSNAGPDLETLKTPEAVRDFNAGLPCGAKLIETQRAIAHFVIGVFELTDRPGGDCGTATGQKAAVAFLIDDEGHIASWIRVGIDSGGGITPPQLPDPRQVPSSPEGTTTISAIQ